MPGPEFVELDPATGDPMDAAEPVPHARRRAAAPVALVVALALVLAGTHRAGSVVAAPPPRADPAAAYALDEPGALPALAASAVRPVCGARPRCTTGGTTGDGALAADLAFPTANRVEVLAVREPGGATVGLVVAARDGHNRLVVVLAAPPSAPVPQAGDLLLVPAATVTAARVSTPTCRVLVVVETRPGQDASDLLAAATRYARTLELSPV